MWVRPGRLARFRFLVRDRAGSVQLVSFSQIAIAQACAAAVCNDRAFVVAMLLDTLSVQLDRVDSAVRSEAVRVSRWMLADRRT